MIKLLLWTVRRCAALAIPALGLVLAAPAGAVPLISLGFYIDSATANCVATTTTCAPSFRRSRRKDADSAHCDLRHHSYFSLSKDFGFSLSGNSRTTFLEVTPPIANNATSRYSLNSNVVAPFVAGQVPAVRTNLMTAAGQQMTCSISGEIKP